MARIEFELQDLEKHLSYPLEHHTGDKDLNNCFYETHSVTRTKTFHLKKLNLNLLSLFNFRLKFSPSFNLYSRLSNNWRLN